MLLENKRTPKSKIRVYEQQCVVLFHAFEDTTL
jgi:hypothetical protein